MTFWTYMLQCADRLFYVGHTDDLERRMGQHQRGTVRGFTAIRRPVHLVWSAQFSTREEARMAEAQLKGWGRPKKLALIRGDWSAISALAKGIKEGASTGSAKPARGPAFEPLFLHPHLSRLPSQPFALEARVKVSVDRVKARFHLSGPLDVLRIPPGVEPARRDNLWQHSCFEIFVRSADGRYLEYNLSPSTEWAAYGFTAYRDGMAELAVPPPRVAVTRSPHSLELAADLALPDDFLPSRIGLSAVLQEESGHKSYWALAHPPGDAPDFHHADCFALEVPSATSA